MKTAIQKLDRLIDAVTETIALCGTSKKKEELMESLSATAADIQDSISYLQDEHKRKFIQVRKALNAVRNVMLGMNEGISSKELTLTGFREANKTIAEKFFPNVRAGLIAEIQAIEEATSSDDEALRPSPVSEGTRNKLKIVIAKSGEMREAISVAARPASGVGVAIAGDGASELAIIGNKAYAELPVRIPGDFKVVRTPIVPIFPNQNLNKPETLERIGLKFIFVEGFTILQDQLMLVVSKSRTAKANTTPLAMAHSVVELLNDRGSVKYEIVSDTPNANPRNTDLLMFWVLPRNQMSGLMKLLSASKAPALVKWGLPLPSNRASVDKARVEDIQKREHKQKRSEEVFLKNKAKLEAKKAAERKKEAQHRQNQDARKAANAKRVEEKLNALVRQNLEHRGRIKNPKLKK